MLETNKSLPLHVGSFWEPRDFDRKGNQTHLRLRSQREPNTFETSIAKGTNTFETSIAKGTTHLRLRSQRDTNTFETSIAKGTNTFETSIAKGTNTFETSIAKGTNTLNLKYNEMYVQEGRESPAGDLFKSSTFRSLHDHLSEDLNFGH